MVGWEGIILSTSDGGATWLNQNSTTNTTLLSVFFVNSDIGFAAGGIGTILASADSAVTTVEEETFPEEFLLGQNYPNPFNPLTTINFAIPKTSDISLVVYDVLGREIQTLVNEEKLPGNYTARFDGTNLPSGVYFYTLVAGNFKATKKLILLK